MCVPCQAGQGTEDRLIVGMQMPPPPPFTPVVTHSRIFHLMPACVRCITASWCLKSDLFVVQYVQALSLH